MRLLILIASFWALVASKPELYKEKDFNSLSQRRVRRDLDFGFEKLGDQLENWGQQTENKLSHGVDDLSRGLENFGQQTQNKFEDFGQKTQSNLEDLGKQTQNQFSLGNLASQTPDKLKDLGQQSQNKLSLGLEGLSSGLQDFGRQTQNKFRDVAERTQSETDKLKDQWGLDHSSRHTQSHWNEQEDLGHKNNFDNFGSFGHFNTDMQSHFGDMGNSEPSRFGQRNQWDHFGDLGQRNQWDNMGSSSRQQDSHFGNLGSFGQSHFDQDTQNRLDRLNDFNRRTDHWG